MVTLRFANPTSVFLYTENSTPQYVLEQLGLSSALPQPPKEWGIVQKRLSELQHVEQGYVLYFLPFAEEKKCKNRCCGARCRLCRRGVSIPCVLCGATAGRCRCVIAQKRSPKACWRWLRNHECAAFNWFGALTLLLALVSLQWGHNLTLNEQWQLVLGHQAAQSFAQVNFIYAQLPRAVMAIVVGAVLGLVGSLMQQLTQNRLTSPLTLGTSSGAWLGLIIVNIWFSDWVADYSALAAMAGALLAFALIISIAGLRNLTGLPLVVSGMVVNILLGSIATALVLLNEEFAQNVFMWGAGDLAQNGWEWLTWLLPRLALVFRYCCLHLEC